MQKIIEYCRQQHMFEPGDGVILGLSGGADSVCLLRALLILREEFNLRLLAVHVHHGIRGEAADSDAAFCRRLCDKYQVEFYQENADVPDLSRRWSMSEEETGRKVRYDCFHSLLSQREYDKIAVAHHQNDLAETMLFHMARGTGPAGLAAMKPVAGGLVRPLLCVSRKEIEEMLGRLGQDYCTDATNADTGYTRNFIRHEIIGRLETVNERAVPHMAELSEKLSGMQDYLYTCLEAAYTTCTDVSEEGISVFIENFQKQHLYIRQEIIRKCIFSLAEGLKDVQAVHVKDILQLPERQTGKKIHLPYGIVIYREYDRLFFEREAASPVNGEQASDDWQIVIAVAPGTEQKEYLLPENRILKAELINKMPDTKIAETDAPVTEISAADGKKRYTKYLDCDKIKDTLVIRYPAAGDYLVINADGQRKALHRYFIDIKIPARLRKTMPVLAEGHHVIWVPGYRISEQYRVTKATDRILKLSLKKGDTNDRKD